MMCVGVLRRPQGYRWAMVLLSVLGLWVSTHAPMAYGFYYSQPYFPENRYKLDEGGRRYQWQAPTKVNINTASLNELETIPQLSQNDALQLRKYRPFLTPASLDKLVPALPATRVQQLKLTLPKYASFGGDGQGVGFSKGSTSPSHKTGINRSWL
ncbi:MAG: helix-hairpin-helix domain-containing protein [Vampirovibrionales bacterium]